MSSILDVVVKYPLMVFVLGLLGAIITRDVLRSIKPLNQLNRKKVAIAMVIIATFVVMVYITVGGLFLLFISMVKT